MNKRDLLVRIDSQFEPKGFKSAEASAKSLVRELDRQEREVRNLANLQIQAQRENERRMAAQLMGMERLGAGFTTFGLLVMAGMGMAAKATSDWESAWAGVTKTTSGTTAEMAALEQQLRGLTSILPSTHEEIAAVAEEAGALGVARQDLAKFTKTAIDLGNTTDLAANDAANGLARLGNVMGVLPTQVDRAGAALVALGNNGASTETEILEMALRIAGAGRTIGLTEAQVLGFASALSSVGIEAEAGGSAISRVMVDIAQAVETGSDKLDTFASVAGMSTQQFSQAFRRDAAGAIAAFINGLGRIQKSGQGTFDTLDELSLSEVRVRDTLLRSAAAGDLLTKSIQQGTDAWDENLALVNEANKRYETSESRIRLARNQLNDAAIDIGGTVLPAIAGAAERVGFLAEAFAGLPSEVQTAVGALGGAVGILSTFGGAALLAIPKLQEMNATLANMGPRGAAAARGLSSVGSALMGPWGIALAGATLALGVWAEKQFEAKQRAEELRASLDQQTGAITNQTKAIIASRLEEEGLLEGYGHLAGGVRELTEAAVGNEETLRRLRSEQAANEEVVTRLAAKKGQLTDAEFAQLDAATQTSAAYKGMFEAIGQVGAELDPQIEKQKRLGEATSDSAVETEGLATGLDETATAATNARVELDKLIESVQTYGETVANARDANRGYEAAVDTAADSLKKTREDLVAKRLKDKGFGTGSGDKKVTEAARKEAEKWAATQIDAGKALDIGTEAGRRNQAALDAIAEAAKKAAVENFKNGDSVEEVTARVLSARDEFVAMAMKMGESKASANALADQLGLTRTNVDQLSQAVENVPDSHTTKINVDVENALATVAAFNRAVAKIDDGVRYTIDGRLPNGGRNQRGGHTFGAGGYTGDGNPADVAGSVGRREFVSDTATTDQWRGLLEWMNRGGHPAEYLGEHRTPGPSGGPTTYSESYDQRVMPGVMNVYAQDVSSFPKKARDDSWSNHIGGAR